MSAPAAAAMIPATTETTSTIANPARKPTGAYQTGQREAGSAPTGNSGGSGGPPCGTA